ncbi:Uncharacterised protein [Vibrio cholerae]|nr:Uncharacterised protein [Vibrio cholerae]
MAETTADHIQASELERCRPTCLRPFLMVTRAITIVVMNMYTGTKRLALISGFSVSKMRRCALTKMRYAKKPEITGVIIQLPTMPFTELQSTASVPTETHAKPIIAPMIE